MAKRLKLDYEIVVFSVLYTVLVFMVVFEKNIFDIIYLIVLTFYSVRLFLCRRKNSNK